MRLGTRRLNYTLAFGESCDTKSKEQIQSDRARGVDEYIEKCPNGIQTQLRDIRIAIQGAAPGSTETVSYFQMPGYFYEGYDYNGMLAWFSFKAPYVRLHVRPPVLENNKRPWRLRYYKSHYQFSCGQSDTEAIGEEAGESKH